MKYEVGNIIYVNSPVYSVVRAKARVTRVDNGFPVCVEILDSTVFNHTNWKKNKRHNLIDRDTLEPYTGYFEDDLFTI